LITLLLLLVGAVILVFILENQQTVGLAFLGFTLPQLSVSVLLVAALLLGLFFGPAMGLLLGWRNRYTSRRKTRSVNK
jgi:uncharacterized integral membrane protein